MQIAGYSGDRRSTKPQKAIGEDPEAGRGGGRYTQCWRGE